MAPITRTCSAVLLALAACACASARQPERSALSNYVQARVADAEGDTAGALLAYQAALLAEPGNAVVAIRAFRQAVENGDRKLALRAAQQLEAANALPSDAMLLLVGDRLASGDLSGARTLADRMEADTSLSFLVPVIRAWIASAAREPDAAAQLDAARNSGLGLGLLAEQRAFVELMAGHREAGIALIKASMESDGRSGVTRLAGAAMLQRKGDTASALSLLDDSEQAFRIARAQIAAGKPLEGGVSSPVSGLAFFYARLASDLVRDRATLFAMTLGRYARFLDPRSPFIALAEGQALAANSLDDDAMASISAVGAESAYAPVAFESRVSLLERLGRGDEALALAQQGASTSSRAVDHVRVGDILTRIGRRQEAATAYQRAIEAPDQTGAPAPWGLWMLKGSALAQGDDWPAGQAALRKAAELGPDQPAILNYLGYSMLERRENLPEATRLISEASKLRPGDTAITDSLGWAYFLSGDYDKAVTALETASLAEPTEPTIGEHLGDAYWRVGRRIDARYTWRSALLSAEGDVATRLADKIDMGLTSANVAR